MNDFSRRDVLRLGTGCLVGAALSPMMSRGDLTAAEPAVPAKPQTVSDYSDAVLVDGEPAALAPGSFTVVVLPDTQKYAAADPAGFLAQTEWVAANQKSRNIACVLHLGDVTDHNRPDEWDLAVRAMQKLDGRVPYFMTLGNHDYSEGGVCADRTTRFNDFFPLAKYANQSSFGGTYDREPDRLENAYHLFSAGDRDFLVLSLEFGPRKDVVRWANDVVAKYPRRAAILITHAYMYFDESRYDWAGRGKSQSWNPHSYKVAAATADDVSDGQQLWDELISKHPNFILTLNGHVLGDGLGRTVSPAVGGRDVYQMLVNFQMKPKGGDGWMRVLEFKADGRTVDVCDFSPTRKQRNESAQNKFQIRTAPVA